MNNFKKSEELYKKAVNKSIDDTDLDLIISWPDHSISLLFAAADLVRRHFFANTVEPCAIMNIKSGACSEDCAFCSQSRHNNAEIPVQPLSGNDDIVENYRRAKENGLPLGLVSSGRRLSPEEIKKLAASIRNCGGNMHASLGILKDEELAMLKEAGVVCYNHNLETSREFFKKIVSTHTYDERVKTVRRAKEHGLQVCCGGIFGLGEDWQDRKSLCLELAKLEVDVIPINFLNAVPGTRVKPPKKSPFEFLKIISLFRFAFPDKIIKVCGGREVNLGRFQPLMFFAGANGYISGDYLTTSGDSVSMDDEMISGLELIKKKM